MPFSPATAYCRFVHTVHELEAAGLDPEAAQALREVADARLFASAPDESLIAEAEATCWFAAAREELGRERCERLRSELEAIRPHGSGAAV
jgi:hypothetical protein